MGLNINWIRKYNSCYFYCLLRILNTMSIYMNMPWIVADYLLVWWWWAGWRWWCCWGGWWWWGGWIVYCQNEAIPSWSYCVSIWAWWVGCATCWQPLWWWNSSFGNVVAYWWWGWWAMFAACWWLRWQEWGSSWWGAWYPNNYCHVYHSWQWVMWQWSPWATNCWKTWWWGWWYWGAWFRSSPAALWGAWLETDISWTSYRYSSWWNGALCASCAWNCWWGGSWAACCAWCNATTYWSWWWWGSWLTSCRKWGNWCQWIFILRYPSSCWYDVTWGTKYECNWYCIHCFTSNWTLTIN